MHEQTISAVGTRGKEIDETDGNVQMEESM